jgi:recombination protein RecT
MATKTMQATQPPQTISAQPEPQQPANLPAPVQIAQQLEKMKPQLGAVLPTHIKVDQFNRVVMTAINLNPQLVAADRRSLFNSCNRCAADGLLPDGREAALVTFGNQVQYMPMVFGIIKKLRNSGEIASVTARLVYEKELAEARFRFVIEDGQERLQHEPMLTGERGKPALVYATAKFKDGTVQNEVMTVADVEKVRNSSRAKNSGPWTQWWDEMARKTVIRRLSKYLPLSAEDHRIMQDQAEDTEFSEMKRGAIAAAPQSLDAARMLGGPAEPETTHDAETGEVIEPEVVQPEYVPGADDQ